IPLLCREMRALAFTAAIATALIATPAAAADILGTAQVRTSAGALLAAARDGSFAYPSDGSVLSIGRVLAAKTRVDLEDVSMLEGVLPPANTAGGRAVALAAQFLGVPYRWGGASPETGFDCSGLTMYVYAQLGIHLSHYTGAQMQEGVPVPPQALQPGDLVFFDAGAFGVPGHEGMYVGGGLFIQAPHTGDVVKLSPLAEYANRYVGAVRPYS